jgi:hypothetical protein
MFIFYNTSTVMTAFSSAGGRSDRCCLRVSHARRMTDRKLVMATPTLLK